VQTTPDRNRFATAHGAVNRRLHHPQSKRIPVQPTPDIDSRCRFPHSSALDVRTPLHSPGFALFGRGLSLKPGESEKDQINERNRPDSLRSRSWSPAAGEHLREQWPATSTDQVTLSA